MSDFAEYYSARKTITEILQKDFIGPVSPNELLFEYPLQYYIMGKLYPQNDETEALDLARNPLLENSLDTYDASVSLSNQMNPSSMGITFTIRSGVTRIEVSGSYAFYQPVSHETAVDLGYDNIPGACEEEKPTVYWLRQPHVFSSIVDLNQGNPVKPIDLEGGLQIQLYTNKTFDTGERVVTVALVNGNSAAKNVVEQNQKAVFQPVIRIIGCGSPSIFTSVEHKVAMSNDPELLELEMLYHDVECYGQGHGCSVMWDTTSESPEWIESAFFPTFNLRQLKAAEISGLRVFNMKRLSCESPNIIIGELREFVFLYKEWIGDLERVAAIFHGSRKGSANTNISRCMGAYNTINRAIDLLEEDITRSGNAFKAFQLANEAMYMQRVQALIRKGVALDDEKINWYPFQLAFILHEMVSFIDPNGPERNNVDLLWFPTGGGKTEAYLGISAYVIFLRRLRNYRNDGVTIIMRYTLRLLTLQQFERASILIFACEVLREKYGIGGTEISIGLWVGGKLTPNDLNTASDNIFKLKNGTMMMGEDKNPCQIQVCPWCGAKITPSDYDVDKSSKRMTIICPNDNCMFHTRRGGLPMHIIDEAIYAHLPSFIVATVDKFAQIPLDERPASLFGISSKKNPPEMIIQDELHLISGPLGTMTGIYEAAISRLCENDGIKAKIVASTATIRNAKNQIMSLYGRPYTQFPPQGLTIKDSFFAVESMPEERPARQYCGVMGIGTTATTTLIRVNAVMLFATRFLASTGVNQKIIDNFWTLTGYFNSLRELGGASTQILDDVQSRFGYLARTKFAKSYPGVDAEKSYDHMVELTSRMNNSEISKVIQEGLLRSYPSVDAYHFVLASNMISVGVDVGRLGAMIVAGQPKTNAEYIQATSRVGREKPGLVITIYNSSRSRDRSHYEQFLKYHSAIYRHVEATSLTPFSDRARDRGLHALFVSLARYLVKGLLRDSEAINFDPSNTQIVQIKQMIMNYVEVVDKDELEAVSKELDDICEAWQEKAVGSLKYKGAGKSLLKSDTDDDRFRTMNSMRSVDGQAGIYLLKR